jgi:hypothetical protein
MQNAKYDLTKIFGTHYFWMYRNDHFTGSLSCAAIERKTSNAPNDSNGGTEHQLVSGTLQLASEESKRYIEAAKKESNSESRTKRRMQSSI